MSLQNFPSDTQNPELGAESYPMPLSSDEVVSAEDVDNLHAIISNSHLEDDDEEKMLESELQREIEKHFPGTKNEGFEELDAEYLPYESRNRNVVATFTLWDVFRKGAINIVLPFINGIMLGFGEILAHEIGFHYGFFGARVQPPRRVEERRKKTFF